MLSIFPGTLSAVRKFLFLIKQKIRLKIIFVILIDGFIYIFQRITTNFISLICSKLSITSQKHFFGLV